MKYHFEKKSNNSRIYQYSNTNGANMTRKEIICKQIMISRNDLSKNSFSDPDKWLNQVLNFSIY